MRPKKYVFVDDQTVKLIYKIYGVETEFLFDKEDIHIIDQYTLKPCSGGYLQCKKKDKTGRWTMIHNVLMSTPEGMESDHINGNRGDNRKSQLRICTHENNSKNRRSKKRYMGVYKNSGGENPSYYAQIKVNGKNKTLKSSKDIKVCARAYNEAAKLHYGEYANLNIIDDITIHDIYHCLGLGIDISLLCNL